MTKEDGTRVPTRGEARLAIPSSVVLRESGGSACGKDCVRFAGGQRSSDLGFASPEDDGGMGIRWVVDWPYSSFRRDVRAGIYREDWAGDAGASVARMERERNPGCERASIALRSMRVAARSSDNLSEFRQERGYFGQREHAVEQSRIRRVPIKQRLWRDQNRHKFLMRHAAVVGRYVRGSWTIAPGLAGRKFTS